MQSDIIFGCETNLNIDMKAEQYDIPGYYNKNFAGKLDQIGRGLIVYSKKEEDVHNIETIMRNDVEYGKITISLEAKTLIILFLYRSEKYPLRQFKDDLDDLVKENENETNVIILGDMNTEELLIKGDYVQLVNEPTTREGTRIDQAYVKLEGLHAKGYVLYKCFEESYHHPICVNITI